MIRQIVKDVLFLEQKSEPATKEDKSIVTDLIDTLKANLDSCVGLAANMIVPMVNPVILKKEKPYKAEESCLSLEGARPTTRYETIEVKYLDANFKEKTQVFNGFVAQIIQHEMDHFEGIII